jgi:ElaB/YqjD/DUF883 family membrane-anchored ribosome-binding protein
MSNQDFHQSSPQAGSPNRSGPTSSASDVMARASQLAGEAANKVRDSASQTAATIGGEVKQLLDQQVSGGAAMVGHLATSAKRAADELDREAPQLAGVVRAFADRMDGYAGNLQDQTVDQLVKGASDFTRRQPALMFGLAAVAGFFVMRTLKSAPVKLPSPPIQPSQPGATPYSSSLSHGS